MNNKLKKLDIVSYRPVKRKNNV